RSTGERGVTPCNPIEPTQLLVLRGRGVNQLRPRGRGSPARVFIGISEFHYFVLYRQCLFAIYGLLWNLGCSTLQPLALFLSLLPVGHLRAPHALEPHPWA